MLVTSYKLAPAGAFSQRRNGYQGEYSETDESGLLSFELRQYDPVIGRWISPDPYNQYHSPYVGMGNRPHFGVDPDGGLFGGPPTVGSAAAARTTQNVVQKGLTQAVHKSGQYLIGGAYAMVNRLYKDSRHNLPTNNYQVRYLGSQESFVLTGNDLTYWNAKYLNNGKMVVENQSFGVVTHGNGDISTAIGGTSSNGYEQTDMPAGTSAFGPNFNFKMPDWTEALLSVKDAVTSGWWDFWNGEAEKANSQTSKPVTKPTAGVQVSQEVASKALHKVYQSQSTSSDSSTIITPTDTSTQLKSLFLDFNLQNDTTIWGN